MAAKIERVNADNITIFYNNNWYAILFTGLVNVESARAHYGLTPSYDLFKELNMITPFCPILENGKAADYVVWPAPPAMTDEIEQEMRVKLFQRRIKNLVSEIFPDLKALIDRNPAEFTTLLSESLIP